MKVKVARHAGVCYGVERALRLADEAVAASVDDLGGNLKPARAMGMHTIKVEDPAKAIAELESILGLQLR